jgi:ABC-type anion transport system duplicated permease subunit
MRVSSRILATVLAAVVWIYAGMSVASRPAAQQAITPSVLDVAASRALAVID